MDLSDMPAELVETVADYLSLSDVQACSDVNVHWRNAFNINKVWKRFCTFDKNYFYKQENKLKYIPDIDFYEQCEAKTVLCKELTVKQNLLNCNFHLEEIHLGAVYCDLVKDVVDSLGNHWLFISHTQGAIFDSKHIIQVWNMNTKPLLHSCIDTALGMSPRLLDSQLILNKDKMLFYCGNCVLVYKFAPPQYDLKFLIKIESHYKAQVITCLGNVILEFFYKDCSVAMSGPPSFYVWSEEGLLVQEQEYPGITNNEAMFGIPTISVKSNNSDTVILASQAFNKQNMLRTFNIYIFDVPSLQYIKCITSIINLVSFDICESTMSFLSLKVDSIAYTSNFTCDVFYIDEKFEVNLVVPKDSITHKLLPGNKELIVLHNRTVSVYDIRRGERIFVANYNYEVFDVTIINCSLFILEMCHNNVFKYIICNFKTNETLLHIESALAKYSLGDQYSFSFIKNYSTPPKIIAFRNPNQAYPRVIECYKVLVLGFW